MNLIDESIYFEALNGFITICSLAIALWVFFILRHRTEEYYKLYFRIGIAIIISYSGLFILIGWRWLYRILKNLDYDVDWMTTQYWWVPIIGALIVALGMSFKLKIYTYAGFGNWPWILMMILALAATLWPFVRECARGASCF